VSRIGLITNPNSGPKADAARVDALDAMAARHLIPVARTHSRADIAGALQSFARAGVEVVAIHGGDGTVDAVLTEIRNNDLFAEEPVLALIPGGTTNMTHADVGLRREGPAALGHLAAACFDGVPRRWVRERRPIAVSRRDANAPFYGFFFATAAIPRVIRATRERLHARGFTGRSSSAVALLWSLYRLVAGRVDRDPILHPDPLRVAIDDGSARSANAVVLLATTLDRLVLGLRPAPPAGRIGVAALLHPYSRLWRRLPGFLRGRGRGALGEDLGRATAADLHLELGCDYTVDGELFQAPADGRLVLRAAAPARFLVL
jgi:diacylglycerol kinase family enzyme